MKPLNEKERTLAFVQFLILFILTIVLTIFFVFFDTKIVKRDYEVLKKENKELKERVSSAGNLPNEIDSLRLVVMGLKKLSSEVDYDETRKIFNESLDSKWELAKNDTSDISKIKIEISKTFKDLGYCIGSSVREGTINSKLNTKSEELDKLKKAYDDLKTDFDIYKKVHPSY
jgi:cell shape-determining protein MreC